MVSSGSVQLNITPDATPPTATCQNITRSLTGTTATITTADINNGSSDACSAVTLVSVTPSSFNCSDLGNNTVTLNIRDGANNTASCTATVTIEDNTNPTAICRNITRALTGTVAGITPTDINNGSTDNCGTVNLVSVNPASFTCSNLGANSVTLTINDGNGNNATCTSTVTITDNTQPVAVCRNITRNLTGTSASIVPADINNGSTDNCGTVNLVSVTPNTFNCSNVGNNTVTLAINDGNGNNRTCTGTVTIVDNTAPTAICRNITKSLTGSSATVLPSEINNGSTDLCGTVNLVSVSPSSFTCANLGANTVTLTINDGKGNNATCTGVVTITDNTPPVAICRNITRTLTGTSVSIVPSEVNNNSTDNCNTVNLVSALPSSFTCTNTGPNNVTLTINDGHGNTNTCVAVVTIDENEDPVADCQSNDVNLTFDANGHAVINPSALNDNSTDNCTAQGAISFSTDIDTIFCSDHNVRTKIVLTARDASNNTDTCHAYVIALDVTNPTANCVPTLTLPLDATGNATVSTSEIDNSSSDNCDIVTLVLTTQSTFDCSDLGANTVTLEVTDAHGLTSTCNTTVTVTDITKPNAQCQNTAVSLDAAGSAPMTATMIDNNSADECTAVGALLKTVSQATMTCADFGTTTVVLTVTDASGNADTCQAHISVQDLLPPVAVCQPTTITLNGSGLVTLNPANLNNGSTDNCVASLTYTANQTSYNCTDLGTLPVVLTVTDLGNSTSSCSTTVTVTDVLPPIAICKSVVDCILDSTGVGSIVPSFVSNGSTDNCVTLSFALNNSSFECEDLDTLQQVILTVTDGSGNSSTCTADVNVTENTNPQAGCQTDVFAFLLTNGQYTLAPATVDNGSVDNCASALTTTLTKTLFTCVDTGSTPVTLTVSDGVNTSTCSTVVHLADTTRPSVFCNNRTVTLNASGQAFVTLTQINNNSFDNCGIDTMFVNNTNFECTNVGTNTVTLTAIDVSGNIASCNSIVTVLDPVAPTASCKNDTIYLGTNGQAILDPLDVLGNNSENCGIDTMILSKRLFNCSNIGVNTVALTIADQGGNTAVCTAQIRVMDTIAPVANCKAPFNVKLNSAGGAVITVSLINNSSTDNCAITGFSVTPPTVNCTHIPLSPVPVTLTATDVSGNTASCMTFVTVRDSTPPTALCRNTFITLDSTGIGTVTPVMVNNGSFDACGISPTGLSVTPNTFTCVDTGANLVTLTLVDIYGNTSSCTSSAILPSIPATMSVAPVVVTCGHHVSCAGGNNGQAFATMSGGCAPFTYFWSNGSTSNPATGLSAGTYTVTATDVLGRQTFGTVTLTAPPALAATITATAGVCEDSTDGTITVVPSGGSSCTPYTFNWGGGITTQNRANLAPGTYNVTIMDAPGCQIVRTATIATLPSPDPALGPDVQKCVGSPVTLQAAPGFLFYQWSPGGSNNPSITVTNPGTYIVTVVNSATCGGKDTIVVTNTPPPSNFLTSQGSTTLCIGDTVELRTTTPFTTYQWNTNATTASINVTTAGTYILTVTTGLNCTGIDSIVVTQISDTLADPVISPNGPIELCDGESTILAASGGFASYIWSTSATSNAINVTTSGTYIVTATGTNGCSKESAPVTVIVNPLPAPAITQNGTTLNGPPSYATYQWYWNGATVTGATGQDYSPAGTGPHFLEVTDTNGCVGTSNVIDVDQSGVSVEDQLISVFGMHVFPNPTDGRLTLEASKTVHGNLQLQVTDLYGRTVLRRELQGLSRSTELDLSQFAAGMYVLEVSHAKLGKATFKVVVE